MRYLALLFAVACAAHPTPPPAPVDLDVQLDPFTVAPLEDQVFCQYVPADGETRWLSSFTTDMTAGSHHLIVFRVDEKKGTPPPTDRHPCDQLDLPVGIDGMLPGSQQPHSEVELPDGVTMALGPTHGLFLQFHYFNPSDTPLVASIRWRGRAAAAEGTPAGMMFFSNFGLEVPPGRSITTRSCPLGTDRTLLGATGHMHQRGVAFDASLDGAAIYHAGSWTDLPLTPLALNAAAGSELAWSCTYDNGTGNTYVFGPSASQNEMCIFAGIFYPSPGSQTDFGC
jgi:hypothetical protein